MGASARIFKQFNGSTAIRTPVAFAYLSMGKDLQDNF